MIEIEFVGAAQTVTGSKHLIHTPQGDILLDCGLFQGHRKEALEKNKKTTFDFKKICAVVLSHAHIDHSGALPLLYKQGYRGPVYTTFATRDLCAPMLMDTASILKSDSDHIQKKIARGNKNLEPVEPLYDDDDVRGILSQMVGLSYHRTINLTSNVNLTFFDAGHVLGSSICVLDIKDNGGKNMRLAFTGDLGRPHLPILRDPEVPTDITHLLMESTYGDRLHDPIEETGAALAKIIKETVARRGKIVIPSFALERSQELIYKLKDLLKQQKIPDIPVYVDSPLAVKLTDVFRLHPECFDKKAFEMLQHKDNPFEFPTLHYVTSVEDSKRIDADDEPCIVISASGMCEGGRVLHHLEHSVTDSKNSIVIVGFQAQHTLGRRIVEKQPMLRIYGTEYELKAEVHVLNGFSAHADQKGLVDFAVQANKTGSLQNIFLVHGEEKSQNALIEKLKEQGFKNVQAPAPGDKVMLTTN